MVLDTCAHNYIHSSETISDWSRGNLVGCSRDYFRILQQKKINSIQGTILSDQRLYFRNTDID
jgi:hypothetical protein